MRRSPVTAFFHPLPPTPTPPLQPLFGCKKSEDDEVIVTVNGEIYNFKVGLMGR